MEQPFVTCAGFNFYSNFDSANFARVEHVQAPQDNGVSKVDVAVCPFEFNVWTRPDCAGTEFENGNRTWFYFGIKAALPSTQVRLNIIDINKQAKMYSQGMAPVYKVVPGKPIWERIRDRPTYSTSSENVFSLSFKYRTPDNPEALVYFAFTYPYSYMDLQHSLGLIDDNFLQAPAALSKDDIYYVRECVCRSIEKRRVDLLTISSYHNITSEREDRLQHLFPDEDTARPFKFTTKKVIFVSARVHPGETPSTFVLNGLLNLLLSRDDAVALVLRRHYVFKIIPFLNPDGVSRGHYRTDTYGTNLNRVYLQPCIHRHPSVFAARALLRYHHHGGRQLPDAQLIANPPPPPPPQQLTTLASHSGIAVEHDVPTLIETIIVTNDRRLSTMSLTEEEEVEQVTACDNLIIRTNTSAHEERHQQLTFCKRYSEEKDKKPPITTTTTPVIADEVTPQQCISTGGSGDGDRCYETKGEAQEEATGSRVPPAAPAASGIFLYIDMHGHASKKGIFMYGNHFDNMVDSVECMLLPKIMSLNNHNFHFTACNFTERNMYLRDRRDGMSREGSGRVAVLKLTGLVRSYTLECNYNTGRLSNLLPPTVRDPTTSAAATATLLPLHCSAVPPKYSPHVFEEVGRALAASILDLTGQNPLTRLPNSEFHTLGGLRQWLMTNCCPRRLPTPSIHHHHSSFLPQQQQQQYGKFRDGVGGAVVPPALCVVPISEEEEVNTALCHSAVITSSTKPPLAQSQGVYGRRRRLSGGWGSVAAARRYSTTAAVATVTRYHHHHRHRRHAILAGGVGITEAPPVAAASTAMSGRRRGTTTTTSSAAVASTRGQQRPQLSTTTSPSKRQQMMQQQSPLTSSLSSSSNSRRLRLREICWIRGNTDTGQGKALIAKYSATAFGTTIACSEGGATVASQVVTADNHNGGGGGGRSKSVEENLIVSWDSNNANPQVFAHCGGGGGGGAPPEHLATSNYRSIGGGGGGVDRPVVSGSSQPAVAGGSGRQARPPPTFRVHNFRRRRQYCHSHPHLLNTADLNVKKNVVVVATAKNNLQKKAAVRGVVRKAALAAAAAATPSTSCAASSEQQQQQQLQHGRLQRSKRKRKRNKSGLVVSLHH